MVLSQPDIRKALKDKKIVFDPPLEESQWGECSVDLRLGRSFTTLKKIIRTRVKASTFCRSLGVKDLDVTVCKDAPFVRHIVNRVRADVNLMRVSKSLRADERRPWS